MKKLSNPISILAKVLCIALVAMFVTSCKGDEEEQKASLAALVPEDAVLVMHFVPTKVIENAGCSYTNGELTLSDDIVKLMKQSGMGGAKKDILNYMKGFDMSEAYFYVDRKENPMFLIRLVDEATVEQNVDRLSRNSTDIDEYTCYDVDGMVFAFNGSGILRVAENEREFRAMAKHEGEKPLTGNPTLLTALTSGDAAMSFFCRIPYERDVPAEFQGSYVCAKGDLVGPKLTFEVSLYDENLKPQKFDDYLSPVSESMFKYLPANANVVAAVGKLKDTSLLNEIKYESPSDMRFLFDNLTGEACAGLHLPFNDYDMYGLIDMGVASEFGYTQPAIDMGLKCEYSLVANYSGNSASSKVSTLYNNVTNGGPSQYVSPTNDGFMLEIPNMKSVYVSSVGNYLGISSYALSSRSNNFASKFNGKIAGAYMSIPSGKLLNSIGINYGAEALLTVDSEKVKFEFNLTGTSDKLLAKLINIFVNDKIMSLIIDMGKYYDNQWEKYYFGSPVADEEWYYDEYYDYPDSAVEVVESDYYY